MSATKKLSPHPEIVELRFVDGDDLRNLGAGWVLIETADTQEWGQPPQVSPKPGPYQLITVRRFLMGRTRDEALRSLQADLSSARKQASEKLQEARAKERERAEAQRGWDAAQEALEEVGAANGRLKAQATRSRDMETDLGRLRAKLARVKAHVGVKIYDEALGDE